MWRCIDQQHISEINHKRPGGLTPSLFIEVPVSSQESERSCICVSDIDFASLYDFSIDFWNCSEELRTKAAHVLLLCSLYSTFRDHLFNIACTFNAIFLSFNDNQKLVFLFSYFNMIRICAKTCNLILNERRNVLYCK